MSETKYIFITGGVCSGLGKGIATASIGAILKASGYSVFTLKLDPYLNIDPGTMSPYQHGEVFVTDDGTETDLDLGHYERFIDVNLSQLSNLTTGQVYQQVLQSERRGTYLGKTIQIIPHITNAIKNYILKAAKQSKADILLIEVGGTVGDIEGDPYLEAARQFQHEIGRGHVMFVLLTLLPFLAASRELKTKPTQMAVRELHRRGIQPDIILGRSDLPIGKNEIDKIALFGDVSSRAVIPALTVESIYEVPLRFEKYKMSSIIFDRLQLKRRKPDLKEWKQLLRRIKARKRVVKVALVGKYTENTDAYISVLEALKSAGYHNNVVVQIEWVEAVRLETSEKMALKKLQLADGIVVPGGFGHRGIEGKIKAARFARLNKVPYLGLCLGMQIATIELAREVLKTKDVNSTEFDPKTKNPVIHILPGQDQIEDKGGTLRLGSYPCVLNPKSISYKAYGRRKIFERHRHRYEFNMEYREILEKNGYVIAGISPDKKLVEIMELKHHPFFVASQFHPEFKSRPLRPHPLFFEFIRSAVKRKAGKR